MAQNYNYANSGHAVPNPAPGHAEGLKIERAQSDRPGTPEKINGTAGPGHDEGKTINKDWAKTTTAGMGTFSNPSRNY